MFEKLGHLIAKRKKPILALFLLSTIFAGVVGSQVFSRFDTGGYMDPNSDSAKVWEYLDETFEVKSPAVVLVVDGTRCDWSSDVCSSDLGAGCSWSWLWRLTLFNL